MAALFCPACGRYSDKYNTDKALTDHMVAIHPDDPRTLARTHQTHQATYGSTEIGKVAKDQTPPQTQ